MLQLQVVKGHLEIPAFEPQTYLGGENVKPHYGHSSYKVRISGLILNWFIAFISGQVNHPKGLWWLVDRTDGKRKKILP